MGDKAIRHTAEKVGQGHITKVLLFKVGGLILQVGTGLALILRIALDIVRRVSCNLKKKSHLKKIKEYRIIFHEVLSMLINIHTSQHVYRLYKIILLLIKWPY